MRSEKGIYSKPKNRPLPISTVLSVQKKTGINVTDHL